MANFLYGVTVHDALTLVLVSSLLFGRHIFRQQYSLPLRNQS
jgi:hypothetical protein